jgi:ABC-type sugar transport system ATPase subunit
MLFDEPLSNVEAGLRMRMRAELRSLHKRFAQTTIYVTHDQTEALALADVIAVMNKGRLEQVATPEELYARPATTFVAGFIGSPPMNLVDVRVAAGRAQGGQLGLDVPPGIGDDVAFVGFRAEHLQLRRGPAGGDVVGRGRVSTVEPLGSETVVSVTVGDALLKSLVDGRSGRELAPGDDVTLAVPAGRRHWFAADGTRATGHDASSPAGPPLPRTKD